MTEAVPRKMKHNIEFVLGKDYYIDAKHAGEPSVVTLLHFNPGTLIFGKVKNSKGSEWDTMLNRLTEIEYDTTCTCDKQ